MTEFSDMVKNDYSIKKTITTRNSQVNSIIERIYQVIGNIIKKIEIHEREINKSDPWKGILIAIMYTIRTTYYTILQTIPIQLVFGRDTILNVEFYTDWIYIKNRKQKIIKNNNARENTKRIVY